MDKLSPAKTLWGRYKYIITLGFFAVLIIFLDEHSVIYRMQLKREEALLRSQIEHYRKEYQQSTDRLNELNADSTSIERIARENYLMKKPNEDVFVFEGDLRK